MKYQQNQGDGVRNERDEEGEKQRGDKSRGTQLFIKQRPHKAGPLIAPCPPSPTLTSPHPLRITHDTVKTFEINHPRQPSNPRILSQNIRRGISVFPNTVKYRPIGEENIGTPLPVFPILPPQVFPSKFLEGSFVIMRFPYDGFYYNEGRLQKYGYLD